MDPKRAVALGYQPEQDEAPQVLASGTGTVAEKILAIAEANGVAIHRDPVLVESLRHLEVGDAIPEALYAAVAEVLVFIQRMNKDRKRR